ncbi:chlorite dismutase family protein [Oceanobacillus sp. CAU 1775]
MEFEALNGWYSLQLFWKIDWKEYKQVDKEKRKEQLDELYELTKEFEKASEENKGSYTFGRVIGHKSDFSIMLLHEDIQQLTDWQDELKRLDLFDEAELNVSFLSVNEATNYLVEKLTLDNAHIQKKLYPRFGEQKYFCFYPMDKKREWFSLPVAERQRMMASHGRIGASYAEKLGHYVANSFGLDDYHWGVTLWGDDFDEFKNIVYEMRFDEASAVYGIFPYFILGEQLHKDDLNTYFLGR